ncbi:MAG: EamA family transporter [Proteobacteria bacterium]|nr:MAG: EamA family transporter [Pseudomonadota bacterium]
MELSFYRWFFVSVLFMPYVLINHKKLLKAFRKNYFFLILFGALGIAGFNTFLYFGLQTSPATNALLINTSTPILIITLSTLILKTPITKMQLLGVGLSNLGVLYLISKGSFEDLINLNFTSGDLWVLSACIIWAFYSIFLKFKPKNLNSLDFFVIITLIGTFILCITFKLFGYSFSLDFIENTKILYSISYMVVFASIISFYLWNISTPKVGANKAGQFTHLMPIFGSFLAYIFLDEKIKLYHGIGMGLIGIGIYLSSFYKDHRLYIFYQNLSQIVLGSNKVKSQRSQDGKGCFSRLFRISNHRRL